MTQLIKVPEFVELSEFETIKERQTQLVIDNPLIKVVDNKTYEQAKINRTNLVKGRTSIEKGAKPIYSEMNKFKTDVKALELEAIQISLVRELEQKAEITPWETKKAEEKLEKERKAKEQLDSWSKKAQDILNYTDKLINYESKEDVELIISEVNEIDCSNSEMGVYDVIGSQNKTKILNQAKLVIERTNLAEKEAKIEADKAEKLRLENIKKEKEKEKENLTKARNDYKEYFNHNANPDSSNIELQKLIDEDKNVKIKKLQELEEKETKRKQIELEAKQHRNSLIDTIIELGVEPQRDLTNNGLSAEIKRLTELKEKEAAKAKADKAKVDKKLSDKTKKERESDNALIASWINSIKTELEKFPTKLKLQESIDKVVEINKSINDIVS